MGKISEKTKAQFGARRLGKDGKKYRISRTPLAMRLRITAKYLTGEKSISAIAREERAAFSTIKSIVSAEHESAYIKEVHAEFVGLARAALTLLIRGMQELEDPMEKFQVGMKLLEVMGVFEKPIRKYSVALGQMNARTANIPNDASSSEFLQNARIRETGAQAAVVAVARSASYKIADFF